MESSQSLLPIKPEQLQPFQEAANSFFLARARKLTFRRGGSGLPDEDEVSILKIGYEVDQDALFSPTTNAVVLAVREGMQIGMHLAGLYAKSSGLEGLQDLSSRGKLTGAADQSAFEQKTMTAAMISMFCTAYFTVWELSRHRPDEVSAVEVPFSGIKDFIPTPQEPARMAMMYGFGKFLQEARQAGTLSTSLAFCKAAIVYFSAVLDEIKTRVGGLQFTEFFTDLHYKLEHSEFGIDGFEVDLSAKVEIVEFTRTSMDEVIGNHLVKRAAIRDIFSLLCYNPETGINPFFELGGMQTVGMWHGGPGNGKSMMSAAMCTLFSDMCMKLKVPYLITPIPEDLIDEYQGKSARRTMDWWRLFRDKKRLVLGIMDDCERYLLARSSKNVSEGQRAVIGVFLTQTEGAFTPLGPHALIRLITNLPEQLDSAVLSRMMDRVEIQGPVTHEDFLDINRIWWSAIEKAMQGFVNMRWPKDYEFMASQRGMEVIKRAQEKLAESDEESVRDLVAEVRRDYGDYHNHRFFARLFELARRDFPWFSGRDNRNIQQAVSMRTMDFDAPQEWWDDPDAFFKKDDDTKRNMLSDLRIASLKGASFADIWFQEAINYLTNGVKICNTEHERAVEQVVESFRIQAEARTRIEKEFKTV